MSALIEHLSYVSEVHTSESYRDLALNDGLQCREDSLPLYINPGFHFLLCSSLGIVEICTLLVHCNNVAKEVRIEWHDTSGILPPPPQFGDLL